MLANLITYIAQNFIIVMETLRRGYTRHKGLSVTFDTLYNAFSILFLFSIPFWIPAAIGLYLLTSRRTGLSYMAGFLTLKPIVATPIWVVIINFLDDSGAAATRITLFSILPGAGLTILALVIFRRLFFGSSPIAAMLLIVLDCMRWINSGLLVATAYLAYNPNLEILIGVLAVIGLIFPGAYSVVALVTTLAAHKA